MNASACSVIPTEANLVARNGATEGLNAGSEAFFNDPPCPRNLGAADVRKEDGFETFVGGDGI
jgi:hypothetical protein